MAETSSPKLEIPLPQSVESMIEAICREQSQPYPGSAARKELESLGEEESLKILNKIRNSKISKTFHGFILFLSNQIKFPSPRHCGPAGAGGGGFRVASQPCGLQGIIDERATTSQALSPQFLALQGLEFRRLFLILSYIGRQKLEDVASVEEMRSLKSEGESLSMGAYECLIWNKFGQRYCEKTDRVKYRDWDPKRKIHYYHCHVYSDGSYVFKGPYLNATTTLLQRVLKDENVLIVKFAEEETKSSGVKGHMNMLYSRFHKIAKEGILLGCKCYRFFAFKDGGKEGRKQDPTSSSVKCYFVNMKSFAQFYKKPTSEVLSVHAARCIFMHVHNLSSLSAYMARFSLILSKTIKLEVNLDDGVCIEDIGDIACKNEDGSFVYSEDGKLLVQTDGTGFISEDLALRCPGHCYKGSFRNEPNFERYLDAIKLVDKSLENSLIHRRSEPPLLIQFRMFHDGCAVKGTVLVNKQLPEKTIQIRPSMIKVYNDPKLLEAPTINSFEIVSTSNRPKKPHFSRFLIALLHYGGVPRQFFTDILDEAVSDAENVLFDLRGALRVALIHGDMDDDFTIARMLLCGIPLEEPHIQWRLPVLAKEEKKSLKEGRLPIKESFYLMGTADPVGCLEEDEVCIIHENGQISGDVLVYRNPGIHFGDIRILKATHQKALEDIVGNSKYGIFFSTKGQRSIADKMAGGDYDGDMYWVSRNPELLRYFTPSEPWICTPSPSIAMIKKPTDFSADDLEHELFQLFLATRFQPSKSMGVAADSWLSYMDRMLTLGHECVDERNFLKEKMIRLVDIYYDALDAPKKGLKVEVPPDLIPKKYPHYMGKSDMLSYKSKSVLGEIFDKADELKLEEPSIRVWKLPNFEVEIPEACLRSWDDHYKTYRSEMTMALSISGESKKEAAGDVINKYKQVLYEADDFDKSNRSWEEIRLDALAVYHVTYDYAIKTGQAKYCGFAWKVAGAALLKAFIDKQDEKPVPYLAASDLPLKMSGELTPAQHQKLMDDDRHEELRKHLECELEEDHKKENKEGKKSKKRKSRVAELPHPPEPKKPKAGHLPSKSFGEAKNSAPLIPKRRSPPPTPQIPSKKKKLTAEEKGKYIAIEDSPQKTSILEPQTKALVLGGMKPFKSTSTQASSERSLYPATPGTEKARFPSFTASKGDDRTIIFQQFLEWVPREEYEAGLKMDNIEAESYYMDMMVESLTSLCRALLSLLGCGDGQLITAAEPRS